MFVKLIAPQTCETILLQDQDHGYKQGGIDTCKGHMVVGTVVLVVHGQDTIEVYCEPCAKVRYGQERTA